MLLTWIIFFGAFGSASTRAEDVSITFGMSTPPYAIQATNSGIDVEIFRAALAYRGHTLKPVFVPAARVWLEFYEGKVDGTSKDFVMDPDCCDAYWGDVSIDFEDVLITLVDSKIEISNPQDLASYRVMGFQTAISQYGEWLEPANAAGHYRETASQILQVRMLLTDRVDVLLGEKRIIAYLTDQIGKEDGFDARQLKVTEFAEPWSYMPVFRSEQIRDDFNAGLQHLRDTGKYDAIMKRFINADWGTLLVEE